MRGLDLQPGRAPHLTGRASCQVWPDFSSQPQCTLQPSPLECCQAVPLQRPLRTKFQSLLARHLLVVGV